MFIYINRSIIDVFDYGEILSGNDVVTGQYENLPYPPFSEERIVQEEEWYKNETTNLILFPNIRMEILNHFLHSGKETFR